MAEGEVYCEVPTIFGMKSRRAVKLVPQLKGKKLFIYRPFPAGATKVQRWEAATVTLAMSRERQLSAVASTWACL